MLVVLPKGHPLNKKAVFTPGRDYGSIDLRHFKNEKFILPQQHQSLRKMANKALEEAGLKPKNIMIIRNIETAIHLVGEGLGVAFSRAGYINHMDDNKAVRYYTIANGDYYAKFVIAWKKGKKLQVHMNRFIDVVFQSCN